jgi:hypothetical protein
MWQCGNRTWKLRGRKRKIGTESEVNRFKITKEKCDGTIEKIMTYIDD